MSKIATKKNPYRRVYPENIKKYLVASGIGIPLVFGLFYWLVLMGDISITGYSGDMTCAGTIQDPCYAFINFTANKDIYIYPTNDTTWSFNTSVKMKSITMQRSWGNSWRTIDLNKTYTKDVKYAIKFSMGQNYSLRFIGYKNNPADTVKWGFSTIDPYWYGEGNTTYEILNSYTTRTSYGNGTYTVNIGASRYAYEDGVWKNIEDARSLKGVWTKNYIEKDPDFNIDIVEMNYTYLELNFTFNSSNWEKYPECGASKIDDIKCDFKLTVKEGYVWNNITKKFDKIEIKFQYKYQEKGGVKETMKFVQKGFPLGREYSFGGNSTTINLGDSIADNSLYQGAVSTNFGSVNWAEFGIASNNLRMNPIFNFSLNSLPTGVTINDARFDVYMQGGAGQSKKSYRCHEITENWVETTSCWMTTNDSYNRSTAVPNITSPVLNNWVNFTVTNMVQKWVTGQNVYGIYCNVTDAISQEVYFDIWSREQVDATLRPRLIVTYTEGGGGAIDTSTSLWLNGTAGSYASIYSSAVNITAIMNISGISFIIAKNGTTIGTEVSPLKIVQNMSNLANATYNITAYWDGNATHTASSISYNLYINKGGQSISLTGITNNTYPYSVTPICTGNITSNLYRNDSSATNNTAIQLGVAGYNWTCNTTTNSNYTFNSVSSIQSITKGSSTCGVFPPTQTIVFPNTISPNATLNTSQSPATLWWNTTNMTSQNNTAISFPAGTINLTSSNEATQNFTQCTQASSIITINKGDVLVDLYLNGTKNTDRDFTNNTVLNATVALNMSGAANLDSNQTGWVIVSGNSPFENITDRIYGALNSKLNFTGYYNATQNYSSSSKTQHINIIINSPQWGNQTTNSSTNVIYQGESIILAAQGFDDTGLDYAWLETNETGTWRNRTYMSLFNSSAGTLINATLPAPTLAVSGVLNFIKNYNTSCTSTNVTFKAVYSIDYSGWGFSVLLSNSSAYNSSNYTWNKLYFFICGEALTGCSSPEIRKGYLFGNYSSIEGSSCGNYGQFPVEIITTTPSYLTPEPLYDCYNNSFTFYYGTRYDKIGIGFYSGGGSAPGAWWAYSNTSVYWNTSSFYILEYYNGSYPINTWVWSNFTWTNSSVIEGTVVGWRIYYNDTSNNQNKTDINTFKIFSAINTSINLWLNNTGNYSANYGSQINATAKINVTGLPLTIEKNGSIVLTGFGSVFSFLNQSDLANATYNITAYWNGNMTYRASSVTSYLRINKASTILYLAINGTEGNVTYGYGTVSNTTGWKTAILGNFTLWKNNSIVSSTLTGNSVLQITAVETGTWNYTIDLINPNYTASPVTRWLKILNISFIVNMPEIKRTSIADTTTMSEHPNTTWSNGTAEDNVTVIQGGWFNATANYPYYGWYKFNSTNLPYFDNATMNLYRVNYSYWWTEWNNSNFDSTFNSWNCNSTWPCVTNLYYSSNQTWTEKTIYWNSQPDWDFYLIDKRNFTDFPSWSSWDVTNHINSVLANATFMLRIPMLQIGQKAMTFMGSSPSPNVSFYPYISLKTTKYMINESSCSYSTTCYQNGTFTPKGQTNNQWMFNVTNIGDIFNVSAYWSPALPSCMNHYLSTNGTFERLVDFNVTNSTNIRLINNFNVSTNQTYWGFFELNNCTAGTTLNSTLIFTSTYGS